MPFLTYTPAQFTPSGLTQGAQEGTAAVNAEHASALCKYELQLNIIMNFEQQHDIKNQWTLQHPEYAMALEYSQHRTFIRAVEELEGLVVQRMFELSKANLAGTGK